MMGLAAVGAVFALAAGWRPRTCIGGIVTIIGGTAGTIIIGTTIIVTGVAGNCDNSARISHRPALLRACFDLKGRLETARLLPAIFVVWFNARSSS